MSSAEATRKTLSVIVPFLNEEENIPILYERLVAVMQEEREELEIVFVDDGSTDGTSGWIAGQAQNDPRIRMLRFSRNFGHQAAITAGLDRAKGHCAVIIDSDLQDPPEVIPRMLEHWREGCEVVYAVRNRRKGESWLKRSLAFGFYRVFSFFSDVKVPMDAGDFRLVDRKVIDALKYVRETHRYMRGLTSWVGFKQGAVYYERAPRHAGSVKYSVWKSLRLAMNAITSFTSAPLKCVNAVGGAMLFAGIIWLLCIAAVAVFGDAWSWTGTNVMSVILSALLSVGGILALCIGAVGQYVAKIFEESKKRPLYIIAEEIGPTTDTGAA